MAFDFNRARQHLQSFNIRKLFIQEMGWDQPGPDLDIPFDGDLLFLEAIAQKRGLSVYVCSPIEDGRIPSYAGRMKIEVELRKSVHEHILIFTNLDNSRQVWQWVRREPGRPTMRREFTYHLGQSGDPLLQRLQKLVMTLEEEENLGIVDVTSRVRAAFDVEPVTRRFYDRYSKEHASFMQFLKGIPGEEDQRWYASVTLNRLMFVYFIQKKLFLNNDEDYLRSKLLESKFKGADLYYRFFLCPLFFEGFAVNNTDRKPEVNRLLGNVPYLNGGIFQQHQLEITYGNKIEIPDSAFERIFDFFDQYRWHLDERPLRNDREINPDVLGYIFEKYINQKEMGAYYTKEDITGYISRSTILPYLIDQARRDCAIAFIGEHSVWNQLAVDPNRYIFPSVKKGVDLVLPPDIEAGINSVTQRTEWNKIASEEYALPTETWREVIARRTRFEELHDKLVCSNVHEVNDLITYNLDIEQFIQDLVESSEGPELLRAFWKALNGITVLDPTCGSGAFLFAALNILEPLYEACLERMRVFITELDQSGENHRPEKFSDFREVLTRVSQHHNERYFILKSIIVNNLYGVDIMDEAVEICKLRLFLKLIAQVDQAEFVEPLPDIDFNIRAGNTLVGFTSIEEVEQALLGSGTKQRLPYPEEEAQIQRIKEEADLANRAYKQFQQQQLERGAVTLDDKATLQERLRTLNNELYRALAKTYGVDPDQTGYSNWLDIYKPFNWIVDFFGIMHNQGFSVVIGNPPYVDYTKINYRVQNYVTLSSNNLYAYISEKTLRLVKKGRIGIILPNSSVSAQKMYSLRLAMTNSFTTWISNYAWRPSKLFEGANMLLSIWLLESNDKGEYFSTKYNRWSHDFREHLFSTISYVKFPTSLMTQKIPKIPSDLGLTILNKMDNSAKGKDLSWLLDLRKGKFDLFYFRAVLYWFKVLIEPPIFTEDGISKQTGEMKRISFSESNDRDAIVAVLSSNLFNYYYTVWSSCQVVNSDDFLFPLDLKSLPTTQKSALADLSKKYITDLQANSIIQRRQYSKRSRSFTMHKQYFFIKKSKGIIDEIDRVLAKYYGFTEEELDFIINYDYKYRMGADSDESD